MFLNDFLDDCVAIVNEQNPHMETLEAITFDCPLGLLEKRMSTGMQAAQGSKIREDPLKNQDVLSVLISEGSTNFEGRKLIDFSKVTSENIANIFTIRKDRLSELLDNQSALVITPEMPEPGYVWIIKQNYNHAPYLLQVGYHMQISGWNCSKVYKYYSFNICASGKITYITNTEQYHFRSLEFDHFDQFLSCIPDEMGIDTPLNFLIFESPQGLLQKNFKV